MLTFNDIFREHQVIDDMHISLAIEIAFKKVRMWGFAIDVPIDMISFIDLVEMKPKCVGE